MLKALTTVWFPYSPMTLDNTGSFYALLYDTVNASDHVAWNGKMTG
jgi:hypothetical protein